MRRKIKILLSCLATAALTLGMLAGLTNVLELKTSDSKYVDFFEQDEDFDVLFLGSSHILNAALPMELWEKYGIVSYNLGGHANQMATTYWTMENALDYTTPKVVVIDGLFVSGEWKTTDIFSYVHLSMDAFPLTTTKVKAVWDLLDDPTLEAAIEAGTTRESSEKRTKLGLLWDYSVYHSRWNALSEEDFTPSKNLEKGAESRIAVAEGTIQNSAGDEVIDGNTISEAYLRKMIEECQAKGIEVLLTYLPFPAKEEYQREANYLAGIAEEYGIHYLNFLQMDVIDYDTDLYDAAAHVNPSGARKITEYLGEYLQKEYGVESHSNDSAYSGWNEDLTAYTELKNENFRAQSELYSYLMLLYDDNADLVLDLRGRRKDASLNESRTQSHTDGQTAVLEDDTVKALLGNLGADTKELGEGTDFVIVGHGLDAPLVLNDFREDGDAVKTAAGTLLYTEDQASGTFAITLDGKQIFAGLTEETVDLHAILQRDGVQVDDVRMNADKDPWTGRLETAEVYR